MSIYICSAIIGAITGTLIGWFVSWRIIKSSEYHKACVRFRSAFVDTKLNINNIKNPTVINSKIVNIIEAGFFEQEKAIIMFEPYISKRCRIKLNEAYQEYKKPFSKNRDVHNIAIYFGYEKSGYTPEEAKQLAINNIEKIISFAKFKRFWFEDFFHKTT